MKTLYERAKALGNQKDERYFIRLHTASNSMFQVGVIQGDYEHWEYLSETNPMAWYAIMAMETILTHFESNQKDENGLLPCPFCGESNTSVHMPRLAADNMYTSWIDCDNCGAEGPCVSSISEDLAMESAAGQYNLRLSPNG